MTSAKLRVLPVVHGCKTGSRRTRRLLKPPNLPICVIKLRKNIRCPRRIISRSQSSVPRHGRDAEKSGARQDICRGLCVFLHRDVANATSQCHEDNRSSLFRDGLHRDQQSFHRSSCACLRNGFHSFFRELSKAWKLACFRFQFPARDAMQLWHKLPPRCGLAGLHRGPETRLPQQLEDPTNGGPSRRGLLETRRSLACGNRLPSPQSTSDHFRLVTI